MQLTDEQMNVRGIFRVGAGEVWEEEMTLPPNCLPDKEIVTLADVGGICWPDAVEHAVCQQTGAVNSAELQYIIRKKTNA